MFLSRNRRVRTAREKGLCGFANGCSRWKWALQLCCWWRGPAAEELRAPPFCESRLRHGPRAHHAFQPSRGKVPPGRANVRGFYDGLLERVRALPGIERAGLVRAVPGGGYPGDNGFAIAEHPPLPAGQTQYCIVQWADAGYFAALGIPLLRGQTFDEKRAGKPLEVIINESFVRKYLRRRGPDRQACDLDRPPVLCHHRRRRRHPF